MNLDSKRWWGFAFGTAILTTLIMLPQAHGELVYEDNGQPVNTQQQPATTHVEDRAQLRQALNASEKAESTLSAEHANTQQPAVTSAVAPAPVAVAPVEPQSSGSEVQNLSKTELLRRERMREEVKNEDILQERLEELRLRDEKRRTEAVLGSDTTVTAPVATAVVAAPLKEETVIPSITDVRAQQAPVNTVVATPVGAAAVQTDVVAISKTSSDSDSDKSIKSQFYVQPNAGMGNMSTDNTSFFQVHAHYAAGISIGVATSDNFGFEAGYTYGEYGVSPGYWYNPGMPNFDTLTMKENIFEGDLKLHVLSPESRIRPFIAVGAGYKTDFMNYTQNYTTMLNGQQAYQSSAFLGVLSTGVDIRVAKAVSVDLMFKYYAPISVQENQNINTMAFSNPYFSPYYSPYAMQYGYDPTKAQASGSLIHNGFYTVTGGLTFSL